MWPSDRSGASNAFESTFELVVAPSTAIRRRQSNVRAHRATKDDWQWQRYAHLPYERKMKSNRGPAKPVLNAFAIAKRFANKLTG
jgi:hypothetical protein